MKCSRAYPGSVHNSLAGRLRLTRPCLGAKSLRLLYLRTNVAEVTVVLRLTTRTNRRWISTPRKRHSRFRQRDRDQAIAPPLVPGRGITISLPWVGHIRDVQIAPADIKTQSNLLPGIIHILVILLLDLKTVIPKEAFHQADALHPAYSVIKPCQSR
jgi:hypothetical protein